MSDEKRQTRLLPFRLRRDGAARARSSEFSSDARDAAADGEEFSDDAELNAMLRAWEAPEPSAGARERVRAGFRACGVRAPLWRRALSAELRVPLPVAACAALVMLASLFALVARTQTPAQVAAQSTSADVRTTDAPAVKIVELPVEHERVVTRYIYVEKSEPRAGAQRLAAIQQSETPRQSTQGSVTATRASVAQSDSNREDASGVRTAIDSSSQSTAEPTSYFTRVDMADFQPAEKMELRIVKRGKTDEK
ncbi:MAG TPA: hypothetical protein VGP08_23450 [Pyrinomonadaceae bacterium]|jgi:hypothetical protein|nr:hypothetical protein [Pyrinomonadaceae bacterium]